MAGSKERNYGIDLLRLVFMFMICMLHTLGQGGILESCETGSLAYRVFWFLKILSYCAVDGFAIISGYMATDKPRRYEKLADMWFQVFFYSFILTLLFTVAGVQESWTVRDIIKCAFPVTFGKFWYVSAYFVLFFAIPVLNRFIFTIDETTSKKALVILVVLFSIIGMVADPFGVQKGYSAIWLMVLYGIGALAKRIKLFETRKSFTLILWWVLCVAFTWGTRVYCGTGRLVNYVSLPVLLSGMILVVLFSRLRMKGTVIGKLAPLAFGIYLFQLSPVIWNQIIKDAFVFVVSKNVMVGTLDAFAGASLIFVSGLAVEWVRSKLAKSLHISALSKKIVTWMDAGLTKLVILLK